MALETEEVMKTPAMEERWQCGKSLPVCLSYMQKRDFLTDVTFIVGESKTRISAHKLILASRSPVFSTMLYGSMQETSDINVPDIEESVFREMLRFIYTENVLPEEKNIEELLYAAEKYDFQGLAFECEKYCLRTTVPKNVLRNRDLAMKYNLNRLTEKCNFVTCKTILDNPNWFEEEALTIKQEVLSGVLGCDELSLPEIYIYRMAITWAEAECKRQEMEISDENIRATFGSALYNIRFPLMPAQIFSKEISTKNVLSYEEKTTIFRQMTQPTDGIMSSFSACPRQGYPDYEYEYVSVSFYSVARTLLTVKGKIFDESFTINRPRLLKGIILIGNKGATYTYGVSLRKSTCQDAISYVMGTIPSIPKAEFNVLLSQPIELKEHETYLLRIQIDGQPISSQSYNSATERGCTIKFTSGRNRLVKGIILFKE